MRISGGRWTLAVGLLLAGGLLVSACGSGEEAVEPPAAGATSPPVGPNRPAIPAPTTATPRVPGAGGSGSTPAPGAATDPTAAPDAPAVETTATPRSLKPTATPIPTPSDPQGSTGRVTMTRGVDSRQRPTDPAAIFGKDERAFVSIEFIGVRKDAVLGVRWLREGVESFVYELDPAAAFSRGFFAFFFDPGGPGSAGNYSVEVLINGEVVAAVEFEVRAGDSAPPAG